MAAKETSSSLKIAAWLGLAFFAAFPIVSSALALLMGIGVGLTFGNPKPELSRTITHRLLQWSAVGLGAGMNLGVIGQVGAHGVLYTVSGISLTLALGCLLGKILKSSPVITTLISVGTAICGGSAIAAVAPVIRAKHHDITVALATVFLLNAAALLVFPWVGHELNLSQRAFGLWSALAIHDTSSVVGATLQYGKESLEVGTTVKLARALWIVPLTLVLAWANGRSEHGAENVSKVKAPWFILGFFLVAAFVTLFPSLQGPARIIETIAKRGLVVTLFLIGSNLSRKSLKTVGFVPLLQGLILWVVVATGSLYGVWAGWIQV